MQDVQRGPAEVPIPLDRVGIKGITLPLLVRDRELGRQHTVAEVELSVDLPADFKGTHMSRFVEALESWAGVLDYGAFKVLLVDLKRRLEARNAHLTFRFPYFVRKAAPVSGAMGRMDYECLVSGELVGEAFTLTLGVDVPVMTVCPCSLAISEQGAHSQRAVVRIRCRGEGFVWLEELIGIAERAGSSPVHALLKREDEKFVTEAAFANPVFVEDVARSVAQSLAGHPRVAWYLVEVESHESIHNHSAFAGIEGRKEPSRPG
ncbi:GTP cyclohydrolase FolE2 [Desulfolutivibrio sulfoxidireducens]|uniref:GTP cyclohydrolase FolE2 n=1 Tax=Desulfolutivibrio sulfoxidireducens TaxID=2773299 RepID=UPI00159D8A27|nr:GTP cyclohydrolase FolE2 [Desulfolutivibrio sulfoxidireducens]QLA20413.1 GTP cyclohydrolase I FolE2 [Desulfolutivibrio sulfoxidireducens]